MSRLHPYAQLVRLPNVFTALADICLGALASGSLPQRWLPFALLAAASACLYSGGMVWNDFFDLSQDQRERPFRPIPSGRVSRRAAGLLGTGLLAGGLFFAGLASGAAEGPATPVILASLLVAAILLYDGWLKRTAAGPLGMGACRFLNVLLGLSVAGTLPPWSLHLALVVGIYIVGVTWFARTEAQTSSRGVLTSAAMVMLAGLLLALALPVWVEPGTASPLFPYLLAGLGFYLGFPLREAIADPSPARVQAAVKRAIFGLVALDAIAASAFAGTVGLVILLLLVPASYLGRWLYST
jgi:4-hydroxybenzoate polyprenyltransferase